MTDTQIVEGDKLVEYKVKFDFTTVHKGSIFVGRSGECFVTAKAGTIINKEDEELIELCGRAVHHVKPSYNIFMLKITEITPTPQSKNKID